MLDTVIEGLLTTFTSPIESRALSTIETPPFVVPLPESGPVADKVNNCPLKKPEAEKFVAAVMLFNPFKLLAMAFQSMPLS